MLVKAESKSKKTMMPSLEDLMGVICSPNSFSTETENLLAKTFGHDALYALAPVVGKETKIYLQ